MRNRALQSTANRSKKVCGLQTLQPGLSRQGCRARRRPNWRGDVPMNLPAESIAALKTLGYTQREAEFLCIVAAHSGFFLQRHFTQFINVAGRGPATYFIKKAIEKQHVREHLPERGTQKIYHLFSRTVYKAIGKENSRHRRPGRYGMLEKAGVRLLTLDFVLTNPDRQYFEEESDKADYFIRQRLISAEILPVKVFPGAQGKQTRRYFFENFPM